MVCLSSCYIGITGVFNYKWSLFLTCIAITATRGTIVEEVL